MQQRQLRLGDILDDYCPRERRVTNHAVVAMVGDDVKQTRCATCETEHEYKHAKVPRQRRKTETPALYAQVLAGGPKRVAHEASQDGAPATPDADQAELIADGLSDAADGETEALADRTADDQLAAADEAAAPADAPVTDAEDDLNDDRDDEEGPVHRPLIRASLPRHDGQAPPSRPIPEFTIRQPAGRPNRFRPRGAGGGGQFQGGGNRTNGNGNMAGGGQSRGGGMRSSGGGRPQPGGMSRRQGPPGRRRSK
jgi:hypothetical protein